MNKSEYIRKKAMIAVLTEVSSKYGRDKTFDEVIEKLKEETDLHNLS